MLIQICEATPRSGTNVIEEIELDTIYERSILYATYEGEQYRVWNAGLNLFIVIN